MMFGTCTLTVDKNAAYPCAAKTMKKDSEL